MWSGIYGWYRTTGTKVKGGLGYNITVGGSHLQVGEEYKKGVPLDELKDVLKEILIERFNAKEDIKDPN